MRSQEASDQRKNPETNIHGGKGSSNLDRRRRIFAWKRKRFLGSRCSHRHGRDSAPQPTQESIKETGRSELRKKWSRVVRFYDFLRLLPLQRPEKGSEEERCGSLFSSHAVRCGWNCSRVAEYSQQWAQRSVNSAHSGPRQQKCHLGWLNHHPISFCYV